MTDATEMKVVTVVSPGQAEAIRVAVEHKCFGTRCNCAYSIALRLLGLGRFA